MKKQSSSYATLKKKIEETLTKQSGIALEKHERYEELSVLKGFVIFYAQTEDELKSLVHLIVNLNRAVILICCFTAPDFPHWIQVIELEDFEDSNEKVSDNIETFALFLAIVQPAGIVLPDTAGLQKKCLYDLSRRKKIPVISLQYVDNEDSVQQKCKKINEKFPFPYLKQAGLRCLNIGCGDNPVPNWLNTDLRFSEKVDFLNAEDKFPYPDSSFHYVFSEHLFEHLSYSGGRNMLHESCRVLKPRGVFRLTMPVLEFLIDLYLNRDNALFDKYADWSISEFAPDIKRDFQSEPIPRMFVLNNFMRFWGHKMIYDKETVTLLLQKTGFREITFPQPGESRHAILKNIERHGNKIPEWANLLESFTIEAKK